MLIHADRLTGQDMIRAARRAGVRFERMEVGNSRSRTRKFDVILSGSSVHAPNFRKSHNTYNAATWDEWGIFLAELFRLDGSVTIPRIYDDAQEFAFLTCDRFATLRRNRQHRRHKWSPQFVEWARRVRVDKCDGCPATRRIRM